MQSDSYQDPLGEGAPAGSPVDAAKLEAMRLLQVGSTSLGLVSALGQMAGSELLLTLKTLPKLAGLALLLLPIALLTWIGLSGLIALALGQAFGSSLAGAAVFFLCQLALLLGCLALMRRYQRMLGIPHTRAQARAVFESMKNEVTG